VDAAARRVGFRDVFASREFRTLWLAQILSVAGDRLALVAITVLVFSRTHSALATASAYAVSYIPWLIGGLLLSGIADRRPRRRVMIRSDVARTGLVGVMTLPGMPVWALILLLFAVTTLAPPFESARAATFADILTGERYVLGTAIGRLTNQIGFVAGFGVGGIAVATLGARASLAVDAATFGASALLIGFAVHARPAAAGADPSADRVPRRNLAHAVAGVRLVFGNRLLRTLTLLAWLAAFYVVPEGLAAPYAKLIGGGPITVGLLLAALPIGTGAGVIAFGRLVPPSRRLAVMRPLAVATCLPLVGCVFRPGLAVAMLLFGMTGVLSAYQLAANAAFVQAVPNEARARAFGIVMSGFSLGQGAALVAAGALADVLTAPRVIAISGVLGVLAAFGVTARTRRRRPSPRHAGPFLVSDPSPAAAQVHVSRMAHLPQVRDGAQITPGHRQTAPD
jgi:MFS family permease